MVSESKDGSNPGYYLPYDNIEDKRLNLQHYCLKSISGGNLLKRVRDSLPSGELKFLDIAGGSGIWAAEVAAEYPNSQVIVLDIRDQRSPDVDFPANCTFMQGDITKPPLSFKSNEFDCVQIRICPTVRERSLLYAEINRILKPGGYLQLVDIATMIPDTEGSHPPTVFTSIEKATAELLVGKYDAETWSLDPYIDGQLEYATHSETGRKAWESLQHDRIRAPASPWPSDEKQREIGRMMAENVFTFLRGIHRRLIDTGFMSQEGYDNMLNELRQTVYANPPPKITWPYNFRLARKASQA